MIYNPPRDRVFNNCGAVITKALVLRALFELSWHIPTAQLFQLERQVFNSEPTIVTEEKNELAIPQTKLTLFGIPVQVDNTIPNSVIELRHNGERLFTIDNLGIPNEFVRHTTETQCWTA